MDRKWKKINESAHLKVCSKKVAAVWDPGYVLVKAFIKVPQQIMIFYIFCRRGWAGKNGKFGWHRQGQAKIWQCNYPEVSLMSQLSQFNCFKAHFQGRKSRVCPGLWCTHSFDFEDRGFRASEHPSHTDPASKHIRKCHVIQASGSEEL